MNILFLNKEKRKLIVFDDFHRINDDFLSLIKFKITIQFDIFNLTDYLIVETGDFINFTNGLRAYSENKIKTFSFEHLDARLSMKVEKRNEFDTEIKFAYKNEEYTGVLSFEFLIDDTNVAHLKDQFANLAHKINLLPTQEK